MRHDIDMDFAFKVSDLEAFDVYEGHLLANGFRETQGLYLREKVGNGPMILMGLTLTLSSIRLQRLNFRVSLLTSD